MRKESQFAVAYIRTARKDFTGDSLNKQIEAIRSYCLKREISLVAIFEDNGVSGSNFNRPGWKSLKSLLANHVVAINHLLVNDLTRLGRNLPSVIRELDELEKTKVAVLSIADGEKPKSSNILSFLGGDSLPPLKRKCKKLRGN